MKLSPLFSRAIELATQNPVLAGLAAAWLLTIVIFLTRECSWSSFSYSSKTAYEQVIKENEQLLLLLAQASEQFDIPSLFLASTSAIIPHSPQQVCNSYCKSCMLANGIHGSIASKDSPVYFTKRAFFQITLLTSCILFEYYHIYYVPIPPIVTASGSGKPPATLFDHLFLNKVFSFLSKHHPLTTFLFVSLLGIWNTFAWFGGIYYIVTIDRFLYLSSAFQWLLSFYLATFTSYLLIHFYEMKRYLPETWSECFHQKAPDLTWWSWFVSRLLGLNNPHLRSANAWYWLLTTLLVAYPVRYFYYYRMTCHRQGLVTQEQLGFLVNMLGHLLLLVGVAYLLYLPMISLTLFRLQQEKMEEEEADDVGEAAEELKGPIEGNEASANKATGDVGDDDGNTTTTTPNPTYYARTKPAATSSPSAASSSSSRPSSSSSPSYLVRTIRAIVHQSILFLQRSLFASEQSLGLLILLVIFSLILFTLRFFYHLFWSHSFTWYAWCLCWLLFCHLQIAVIFFVLPCLRFALLQLKFIQKIKPIFLQKLVEKGLEEVKLEQQQEATVVEEEESNKMKKELYSIGETLFDRALMAAMVYCTFQDLSGLTPKKDKKKKEEEKEGENKEDAKESKEEEVDEHETQFTIIFNAILQTEAYATMGGQSEVQSESTPSAAAGAAPSSSSSHQGEADAGYTPANMMEELD